jgi:hypothetical protein
MESIGLLFKVFWAPGEAMFKASKRPGAAFVAIGFLMIAGLVTSAVMFTHLNMGELTLRMLDQNPRFQQLSAEQKQQIVANSNGPLSKTLALVGAAITPILMTTVLALIFFGLFTFVGRDAGFKVFFVIAAFALLPLVFRYLASVLTVMIVPSSSIMPDELGSISPSIFVDRTTVPKMMFTLLNQIDIVTLWILSLLVIGYRFAVTKSVSVVARVGCVFGIWLVWVALRVALSSVLPF